MTLESESNKIVYEADGESVEFFAPFTLFGADGVECISVAGGAELPWESGFEALLPADGSKGARILFSRPPPAGRLVIRRRTRRAQTSAYPEAGRFPAGTLERDLDRLTAMIQDMAEYVDRCVKAPADQAGAPGIADFFAALDERLREMELAAKGADAALEEARALLAMIPAPEAADAGALLAVSVRPDGSAGYALQAGGGGGGGLVEYVLRPPDASGEMNVSYAALGRPNPARPLWPLVSVLAVKAYICRVTARSRAGFSLQICAPDGTPGVEFSAHLECGAGAACGEAECGEGGRGADAEVIVLLPAPS